jgi:fructose-specific component phosphotransferase system IIB-like protein
MFHLPNHEALQQLHPAHRPYEGIESASSAGHPDGALSSALADALTYAHNEVDTARIASRH